MKQESELSGGIITHVSGSDTFNLSHKINLFHNLKKWLNF